MLSRLQNVSVTARLTAGATAWLIAVCWGHVQLNYESQARPTLKMGYMPVITNLAAPILDHVTEKEDGLRFEAIKFSSFADMGAALRDGHIDAGFMIAPLAIVMRQQGLNANIMSLGGIAIAIGAMVDAALVMIEKAHKHLERDKGKK